MATCAPHYYRIMRQRAREEGVSVTSATFGMDAMTRGCLGGTGFCFISHVRAGSAVRVSDARLRQRPHDAVPGNLA